MARFVPCHKEIIVKEKIQLFDSNYCKVHDVPKALVSDGDPKFVGKFWHTFLEEKKRKKSLTIGHVKDTGSTVGMHS